jgi:hypothetical protein
MPRKPPKERTSPALVTGPKPTKGEIIERATNIQLKPPLEQSSALLLLPAEVRTKIWRLLFEGTEVHYINCRYSKSSSIERNQIAHTCRFAYLDTFTMLWTNTAMDFTNCLPSHQLGRHKNIFAASAPCRKLIPKMKIITKRVGTDKYYNWSHRFYRNLNGLRHYGGLQAFELGTIQVDHVGHLNLPRQTVKNAENNQQILRSIKRHRKSILHEDLVKLLRNQDRNFGVTFTLSLITDQMYCPSPKEWVVSYLLDHGVR